MEGGAQNRRRRLRRDLRGPGPDHARAGRPQGGVGAPAQAGAENGSGRAEEAAGQGARLPVHRLRPQRSLQLRRDAVAGQESGRTAAGAAARRLLAEHDAAAGRADPAGDRVHTFGGVFASGY